MPAHAYDVIVIGAGHAGIEAASAAARLGCRTALVSGNLDTIGKMSCNPSIGGLAKGQLAREIDALGGLMGLATDATGIQFRMLASGKGPALWSPRAQCDKAAYAAWMKQAIETHANIFPVQGEAWAILTEPGSRSAGSNALVSQEAVPADRERPSGGSAAGAMAGGGHPSAHVSQEAVPADRERPSGGSAAGAMAGGGHPSAHVSQEAVPADSERQTVTGVALRDGRTLRAPRVVCTTGTFLRGLMHQGETTSGGGRMGDAPAQGLSESFTALGLRLLRHKTGTPCRLHADSIRWDLTEEQPGDDPPRPFSFRTAAITQAQISCWTCRTTPVAHAVIHANLHRSPMYNGRIASIGPRYCPSIEDKVVRFADKDEHHLFLEPEGRTTKEIYVNGLSTSLPLDVQDAILAAIPALAGAHVLRYGYAVEYDVVAPDQMDHRLECRAVAGLHFAGQINGTSGYEEAAAQGLVAGANAALSLLGHEPLLLSRGDAYLGVLVDDLVTRLPEEPYRMFTSRAEHRLHLRADNADRRLTGIAARLGLVDQKRAAEVGAKAERIAFAVAAAGEDVSRRIAGEGLAFAATCDLLPHLRALAPAEAEEAWTELRYHTYLDRQSARIEKLARFRDLALPMDLDVKGLPGLSFEGRKTLLARRPRTLGEIGSLPGVSQADVETLWAHLQARRKRANAG